MRTFKESGKAVSNANVPLLLFSNFFLPTISLYSTRLNSAQLTTSSQLSSSYQPINSSRLSSTNSQDYHLRSTWADGPIAGKPLLSAMAMVMAWMLSWMGMSKIFLVVAGSRLVVLDGCCALRASLPGSTQRGTAPRPFAPTFPATLRRPGGDLSPTRRRPFAVTIPTR